MTISSSSSPAVGPTFRIPKSSMISKGTVDSSSMCSLRFPSRAASAISSEQDVRFAVDHTIALTDDGLSDGPERGDSVRYRVGLRRARLHGDRRKGRGQIEDQASIHLPVEVEVEVVESPLWIAELCLLANRQR